MKGLEFRPKLFTMMKTYTKADFMTDLMAGIIVGIVALPLAIAFGIASGVSPEKGIITAIVAGFIISFLGGSKVQIGGPTGAFIVIIYGIIQEYGIDGLMVATMMAGVLLILLGIFKLGAVIKFIPYPIIIGFTSGIAVTIFTTQIADIFGLDFKGEKVKIVPISMSELADKLFNGDQNALRGFLIIRADEEINSIKKCKLPRIRFHQFYKYIEGLWAELLPQKEGEIQNPFGKLFYSPKTAVNSNDGAIHKVLETLRCEKCATAFIGGNKNIFSVINGQQKWELNLNNPDLSKIPNNSATPMVQNKRYNEYAVFWPCENNTKDYYITRLNSNNLEVRDDFNQSNINGDYAFSTTGVTVAQLPFSQNNLQKYKKFRIRQKAECS
jgi:hypothetical protein